MFFTISIIIEGYMYVMVCQALKYVVLTYAAVKVFW